MTAPVVIIGGGPAGLMAAEVLAERGVQVAVFDAMPTFGRKFLLAGRGGLNLTHTEPRSAFVQRYQEQAPRFERYLARFGPEDLRVWAAGLGVETFVGTSGRVFPVGLKASTLLRAWLRRLDGLGVTRHPRHRWQGFDGRGRPVFAGPDGAPVTVEAAAVVLALGGASWPRVGTDGGWAAILAGQGVKLIPFRPANCGFTLAWSNHFRDRYEGQPLKNVVLSWRDRSARGDVMVTRTGIEGGPVYAISRFLRDALADTGGCVATLDLKPGLSETEVRARLQARRGGETLSTTLRKALGLHGPVYPLLREAADHEALHRPAALAALLKALPLRLTGTAPLERAISTAGGVPFAELDDALMLRRLPGVFVAGEMLDWEAPTGGYLLQGAFSTGHWTAQGVLSWLKSEAPQPPSDTSPV